MGEWYWEKIVQGSAIFRGLVRGSRCRISNTPKNVARVAVVPTCMIQGARVVVGSLGEWDWEKAVKGIAIFRA